MVGFSSSLLFYFVCVVVIRCIQCRNFVSEEKLDEGLQIATEKGIIQGRLDQTASGRPFWSYRGIPYARPPVNNLRFRPPKPADSWHGKVLDATKERATCVEILLRSNGVFTPGSEDCLFINVFTSKDPKKQNRPLPVLVWFYGGAFIEGNSSSTIYGPDYLLEEDVVVVTFNYRTGLYGFLSTEDSASPGNYGLKDQLLALQWIQRNIKNFGGDPSRVTIFGQSAGAVSVLYHMASPRSKGLFHRAIASSGSTLCSFGWKRDARQIAFKIGMALGINTKSSTELVSKLRKIDAKTLNRLSGTLGMLGVITLPQEGFPFGPVIERRNKDAFITESTYSIFEKGNFNKVPILLGVTAHEAVYFEKWIETTKSLTLLYDLSPGSIPRLSMNIRSFEERREAGNQIKKFYFKEGPILDSSIEDLEDYISDDQFFRPMRKTTQLLSKYIPTYFYVFSYKSDYGLRGLDDENRGEGRGPVHVEDLTYIWKGATGPVPKNVQDRIMISRMVKMWTNFAKTGNPTPQRDPLIDNITWLPVESPSNINYLNINTSLSIGLNFRKKYMQFWDYIYERYGGNSYITY